MIRCLDEVQRPVQGRGKPMTWAPAPPSFRARSVAIMYSSSATSTVRPFTPSSLYRSCSGHARSVLQLRLAARADRADGGGRRTIPRCAAVRSAQGRPSIAWKRSRDTRAASGVRSAESPQSAAPHLGSYVLFSTSTWRSLVTMPSDFSCLPAISQILHLRDKSVLVDGPLQEGQTG